MTKSFKKITVKDDDESFEYLSLNIQKNEDGSLKLTQPGFIKSIFAELDLDITDVSRTPCDRYLFDVDEDGINEYLNQEESTWFKSNLMKMMYLVRTRPDIKLTCVFLSTRMSKPTVNDKHKLLKLLKYVNGTRDLGIRIAPKSLQLFCSVDASHAVHGDLKGHTGGLLFVGDGKDFNVVETISKKQKLVAASSTEAELIALSTVGESVMWTRQLLQEIGCVQESTVIEQDNKSTMIMVERGPGNGGRSKAINIKYYWISQHVENGDVVLKYVPTEELIADGFTKPLAPIDFERWRSKVLNVA